MKAMDGFLFYNSSPTAGASQSHKHLQVIPVSSLPNKKIPIQEKVLETIKRSQGLPRSQPSLNEEDDKKKDKTFILSEYQSFKHIFHTCQASQLSHLQTEEHLKSLARTYHSSYLECLQVLNNADGKLPYNFMVTKDWMMMVLR